MTSFCHFENDIVLWLGLGLAEIRFRIRRVLKQVKKVLTNV